MSQTENAEENRYVFKAPSDDNLTDEPDETGAIVGALAACLIISAVLLFLWKMLQRKKKEMKQIHNVDEEVAVGADDEKTIYDDNVEIANKQIKKQCREVDKRTIRNQVQLPHSTIKIKKDFHEIKKNSENELIIPSLSPMPSCSWSLHEELTSSDTGYNSEIVRRFSALKRRQKSHTDELYQEYWEDILQSLKLNRRSLRIERENRTVRLRNAMEILASCRDLIEKTKEHASIRSPEAISSGEKLQKMRIIRNLHETQRRKRRRRRYTKEFAFDQKEAFVAMQERFDGLQVQSDIRQVAEEIFLLRSFHRSDLERDAYEARTVQVSISCIRSCLRDIFKMKTQIQRWKNQKKYPNFSLLSTSSQNSEYLPTSVHHPTNEENTKKNLFPDSMDNNAGDEFQSEIKNLGEFTNRCLICHRYVCQCASRKADVDLTKTDSQTINEKLANEGCKEAFQKDQRQSKSMDHTLDGVHANGRHTVTLKLQEAPFQDAQTDCNNLNDQLNEKEVQKALQRVPYITMLNSLKKIGNNEWTITAISSQKQVANVRFNCRKKAFIIGMSPNK